MTTASSFPLNFPRTDDTVGGTVTLTLDTSDDYIVATTSESQHTRTVRPLPTVSITDPGTVSGLEVSFSVTADKTPAEAITVAADLSGITGLPSGAQATGMITASGDGTATLTYTLPEGHGGGTLTATLAEASPLTYEAHSTNNAATVAVTPPASTTAGGEHRERGLLHRRHHQALHRVRGGPGAGRGADGFLHHRHEDRLGRTSAPISMASSRRRRY